MSRNQQLSVSNLAEYDKIPWTARMRLRRAIRRGRTGALLHAEIREPPQGVSLKSSVVSMREPDGFHVYCGKMPKLPAFVELKPGRHDLQFMVTRMRGDTSFSRAVDLKRGDVLVALCEPIQPNVFYKRSPSTDTWRIGVVSPDGAFRSVE